MKREFISARVRPEIKAFVAEFARAGGWTVSRATEVLLELAMVKEPEVQAIRENLPATDTGFYDWER